MVSRLSRIADGLRSGNTVQPVTVRTFLSWFGAQRRGPNIVAQIREELEENSLETDPDFESCWIDSEIEFFLVEEESEEDAVDGLNDVVAEDVKVGAEEEGKIAQENSGSDIISWKNLDATYRVSKLKAANKQVVSVRPDGKLEEIVTILMSHGFSQIPVMTSEREVKGMVTWGSIGIKLCCIENKGELMARDFMVDAAEIHSDRSLFEAIPIIVDRDYVLVRSPENKISGIITASDLSLQFQEMTEPFLLLHEIENLIRNIVGSKFDLNELNLAASGAQDGRSIQSVADLTYGEYIRLLQMPENWNRLGVRLDRVVFCNKLDRVRQIRNDVLHFDPDGIVPEDLRLLREFGQFLKQVDRLLAL